ncbi:MAG: UDP-2,3-diacylglucosamine diphosphatase LpxI [Candidatus Goldbacteria bacterium]|nr:UDP-2,3-diacylglucosamine diphosphatase LpxI [Candidatus Goldiibacteriota bacterium]
MKIKRIGLIAGGGELPFLFLKKAREKNIDVVLFSIHGETDNRLHKLVEKKYDIKLTALSDIIKSCKKEKIKKIILLGYVRHSNLIKNIKFDLRTLKVLLRVKDKRASSILKSAIKELKTEGIDVIDSRFLLSDIISGTGFLTKTKAIKKHLEDIFFGYKIAKKIAAADIGQTVVIKNKVVISVEAIEGTDECIKRGAKLAGAGFVVVKVARPNQDMRFDIPVIGIKTIKILKKYNAAGIAIEAGKTFLLDKEKLLRIANKNKIFIYGM